jgi:hypothetical protein
MADATRIQGRKTLRRVRSVPAHPEVRQLPSRTADDAEHDRAHLRVGRDTRGRGAEDAVLDVRRKAMLGAGRAGDRSAPVQESLTASKVCDLGLVTYGRTGVHREESWMHATLVAIKEKLSEVVAQVKTISSDEPAGRESPQTQCAFFATRHSH